MISLRARRVITGLDEPDQSDASRWLTFDRGEIIDVGSISPSGATRHDLGDLQIWPGIVDLHSDSLQHFQCPRPGTRIPLVAALYDYAVDAITHGITAPYLCVSIGEGPGYACADHRAHAVLDALDHRSAEALPIAVLVHLRVDIGNPGSVDAARALLGKRGSRIRLVSTMDHTPGQGQYRDERAWRAAMGTRLHLNDVGLDEWLDVLRHHAAGAEERRRHIASLAIASDALFAVHDPEDGNAVAEAHRIGASICEFPLTATAAAAAHRSGLAVALGAPNAWRGASHLQNLSAREAISAGTVDVLTSDYHNGAMARAAIALHEADVCSLDTAVSMISRNPAAVMAKESATGTLTPGQAANFIAVRTHPISAVVATWAAGRQISGPRIG